jgi:hypothetical protein
MLHLVDNHPRASGLSRRAWLGVGALSTVGIGLPQLLAKVGQAAESKQATPALARGLGGTTFGRAKNVIFLWLQGGPPQHETFDPKPDAPAEIRGPFRPIATNVHGIQFCELLPRTSRIADQLAVVRSLYTNDNNHDVSGYWVLTGNSYGPGSARQIKPTDWPYFGSLVKMLKPSEKLPALTSVWVPDIMRLNENVTPAGQTAGFLGGQWEPERFIGDPAERDYRIDGLQLPNEVSGLRADRRFDLLSQINRGMDSVKRRTDVDTWHHLTQQAFDLVTSGQARAAFDVSKEPVAVRERYGTHSWGQTVLLARRLIEAGVRLVHVNWPREPGDNAVNNPMWDTHSKNADRLQDCLCPQFDVGFTALIDDLRERGLLDETLVVAVGEFGRTPKINREGGRDHWGNVFHAVLAGAGISGGQVFGASDKNGALPAVDPIRPHDLTATLFHLLGIDPGGMFRDKIDRPHPICKGRPLVQLLGNGPATDARCEPGGDLAFVPPYDDRKLLDTDFRQEQPLIEVASTTRDKGWRATPIMSDKQAPTTVNAGLIVTRHGGDAPQIRIGLSSRVQAEPFVPRALLAQEIRNARSGHYTFTIRASGRANSADGFAQFAAQTTCRLVLFRYATQAKDATQVQELASETFVPTFASSTAAAPEITLSSFLGVLQPGANFSIGNGLGVAVVVELRPTARAVWDNLRQTAAYLQVDSVRLEFNPKPRDSQVTV